MYLGTLLALYMQQLLATAEVVQLFCHEQVSKWPPPDTWQNMTENTNTLLMWRWVVVGSWI